MRIDETRTVKQFVESPLFFLWRVTRDDSEIHHCYGCSLIQDELKDRIERDIDLRAYTKIEYFIEDIREMCDYCWCPKYGGKTWWILEGNKCQN